MLPCDKELEESVLDVETRGCMRKTWGRKEQHLSLSSTGSQIDMKEEKGDELALNEETGAREEERLLHHLFHGSHDEHSGGKGNRKERTE